MNEYAILTRNETEGWATLFRRVVALFRPPTDHCPMCLSPLERHGWHAWPPYSEMWFCADRWSDEGKVHECYKYVVFGKPKHWRDRPKYWWSRYRAIVEGEVE